MLARNGWAGGVSSVLTDRGQIASTYTLRREAPVVRMHGSADDEGFSSRNTAA
jgi:hypothetical protein